MAAAPASTRASAAPTPSRRGSAPAPAHQPSLRLAGRPRRTRRWLAALGLAAFLGLSGVVGLSAAAAQLAFAQTELEAEVAALESRVDALEGEVAELGAPERIEAVATEELGMQRVEEPRFVEADPAEAVPVSSAVDEAVGDVP